jgi:GMP synthase (glutamine-hydrolysing)
VDAPLTLKAEKIKELNPKGIIFTGGASCIYDKDAPMCSGDIFELGIRYLGICFGMQLIGHAFGWVVDKADISVYGRTDVNLNYDGKLLMTLQEQTVCWMSHTYCVKNLPEGFVAPQQLRLSVAAFEKYGKKSFMECSFIPRWHIHLSAKNDCLIFYILTFAAAR